MKKRADKTTVERRVLDMLEIRLNGARSFDLCSYVREQAAVSGSPWFLGDGEPSLSTSQVHRYCAKADALIQADHERSRQRLFRISEARLYRLWSKAVDSGDLSCARAILHDIITLQNLWPNDAKEIRRELDELKQMLRDAPPTNEQSPVPAGIAHPAAMGSKEDRP